VTGAYCHSLRRHHRDGVGYAIQSGSRADDRRQFKEQVLGRCVAHRRGALNQETVTATFNHDGEVIDYVEALSQNRNLRDCSCVYL
jgi:hypothetical protein